MVGPGAPSTVVRGGGGGDDNLIDKDRDPVPRWNGNNPMVNLKPYLRQLEIWRHDTSVPIQKHGTKLYKSLELGTPLRAAAEHVPDPVLMGAQGFDAII